MRFKLPLTIEDAVAAITASIEAEVTFRHRTFTLNESVQEEVSKLATWLTGDASQFGVMLSGTCGNGKSTMMKAFQQLLNAMRIPNRFPADGHSTYYGMQIVDAKHIAHLCKNDYSSFLRLAKVDMLGIDDLGTEPIEVMDYGNVLCPVIDLLTKRYEEQLFTFVTTNLTPKEIRERYGERIADRLNEMMFKIGFSNPTFRL